MNKAGKSATPTAAGQPHDDPAGAIAERFADHDWSAITSSLDGCGFGVIPGLLGARARAHLSSLYDDDRLFRSTIDMRRHSFGAGEYKYFGSPLPPLVEALRQAAYPRLAPIANAWAERLGDPARFPADLDAFTTRCHAIGQTRPTPLLLKYGAGDYNRLHQDLYGDLYFPLQMVVLLSAPGRDFTGGEFVLTELKPRSQSRVEVVPLEAGDACLFAVHHRPAQGARGVYRAALRHGVSTIRTGHRMTLGVIFHDAR
jgi:uncharacterized protein